MVSHHCFPTLMPFFNKWLKVDQKVHVEPGGLTEGFSEPHWWFSAILGPSSSSLFLFGIHVQTEVEAELPPTPLGFPTFRILL